MGAFSRNIRYGLRVLACNPGFSATAVLCLALGIGATTAIFSVVNAVLLRPLPYAQSDRLVRVFTEFPTFPHGGLRHFWVSPPEYFDLKRDTTSWDAVEGWVNFGVNLAGESDPIRAQASAVTGGLLPMLGVQPLIGRPITPADDVPNAPATAVLSYALWQRGFGGETQILGRDIRLNGKPCTVVGVMPASFVFPPGDPNPAELWTPLQLDPANPGGRGSHYLSLVARRKTSVSPAQATAEMARYVQHSAATRAPSQHPFDPKFHPIVLADFQDEVVHNVKRAMLVLLGAVGFVLLIACVNVANLLLARAEARRKEIAVRTAIGAGLGKLLQQFVTEGILLSLAGAVLGVGLALAGLKLLVATNAGSIPRVNEINIDWRVLLFAVLLAIATGIVFGLAPVLHIRPGRLHDTLKSGAGRTTSGAAANRFRAGLVTSELALALILLIGSGLMVKAFWKLQQVNAGINPDRILTMRITLPGATYSNAAQANGFWQAILGRVRALPGVEEASIATGIPPDRPINANDTTIEGFVPVPNGPMQNIDYWNFVSPEYFESVGARLMEGRLLNQNDGAAAPAAVVINQTMARTFWPRESALGHRVRTEGGGPAGPGAWRTVVGVVADIKNGGLDRPAGTELFIPYLQQNTRPAVTTNFTAGAFLVIRTKSEPLGMAASARQQIRELDRALPVSNVQSMEDVMSTARARPRFLTLLLTLFSGLSLVLAALGIYGVISYLVAQRTNEIGIRMALGAKQSDVVRLVSGTGVRLALAGTVLGAIGAFALTRFLSGLLFGVNSADPVTFLAMAAGLGAVVMAACYIPARRASKVDPLIALRYE